MKRAISIFLCTLLCFCVAGCATKAAREEGKLNIVATSFPEYDFARAVAGDLANICMLLAPGASAHSFDPSPADILRIQNADVFIYTGGENDAWVENLLAALNTSHTTVICLMDYLESSGTDPHIWTSPKNALQLLEAICNGIRKTDSIHAETYSINAEQYREQLVAIDEELTEIVINGTRNKIIVADRFPFYYLATDYGLDYEAAFSGCSDQADAGAKTLKRLVDVVTEEKIPYIYYVELSNRRVAEAVSEQTGAGMLLLHSCHNVTKTDFESGVTYVDLMHQNLIHLKMGLSE